MAANTRARTSDTVRQPFLIVALAVLLCVIGANVALAWTPEPLLTLDGQFMWDLETSGYPSDHLIPYIINPTVPPGYQILPEGTTEDEIVNAIRNVFQAWANVPTSKLRFRYLGIDRNARFADDGIMLVTLDFRDPAVSCDHNNFKRFILAPAKGTYTFSATGQSVHVERPFAVVDADIVLCVNFAPVSLDRLSSLLLHEVGHLFGLNHSVLTPSAMGLGYVSSGKGPLLSRDDMIGISVLYPKAGFFESTGTLEGVVREVDARGSAVGEVFGAHVSVIDAATGEAITETISGVTQVDPVTHRAIAWDRDKRSGRFVISGLPPGDYRLRVDAYDGPLSFTVRGRTSIIFMDFWNMDGANTRRDFGYLLDSRVYHVAAGQVTFTDPLQVGPFAPNFPNVDGFTFGLHANQFTSPAVAFRGETTTISVAKGVNVGLSDNFRVDGANEIRLSNPRISNSGANILLDAAVPANSPLGPHSLIIENAHGFSIAHGGLIIASASPQITDYTPRAAVTGTPLQISGRDLTPDAQVYFDGLLAPDLVVLSPTLITATAPKALAGTVRVSLLSQTGEFRTTFAAPASPPSVRVDVSSPEVAIGQQLILGLTAQNPPGNQTAELYAGVLLPDGRTIVFLSGQGALAGTGTLDAPRGFIMAQPASPGFALDTASFAQLAIPATAPLGIYRAFVALVTQGAFDDNRVDGGDVLAIDVKQFTVRP